jgi:hypothetical protein
MQSFCSHFLKHWDSGHIIALKDDFYDCLTIYKEEHHIFAHYLER